ncbi:MAG: hypothetical protein ACTHMS_23490 [Jatrophihabitans sp.]|uniref:hypothetical protein n=1 Tax=Jatrophihabitans sp. TaxID=1932789 RepID=UPI003F7D9AC3
MAATEMVRFTARCACGHDALWVGRPLGGNASGTRYEIECARCDGWTMTAQVQRWAARPIPVDGVPPLTEVAADQSSLFEREWARNPLWQLIRAGVDRLTGAA